MLRKSAAVLAVVLWLGNVNATRADAGPVVNWLMSEPASLFDLGMLRLQTEATKWTRKSHIYNETMDAQYGTYPGYEVWYDWDENRIFVESYLLYEINIIDDAKQACRIMLDAISQNASVDPETGEPTRTISGSPVSEFARYFRHSDYATKNTPDNYMTRLDKIFMLRAVVNPLGDSTTCFRPLLSNKVYFEE